MYRSSRNEQYTIIMENTENKEYLILFCSKKKKKHTTSHIGRIQCIMQYVFRVNRNTLHRIITLKYLLTLHGPITE